MIKHSLVMTLAELTRANRIQGLTDGKRDLPAQRKAVRERMRVRAELGEVEQVGRSSWRVIYARR